MANVGDYLTIKGVKKRWAGENYGWQTPASYNQLEKQGKFKFGAQLLDRLGSYLGPAVKNVQNFQQQVKDATPWLDPVDKAVTGAMMQEDRLPSSVVARGGAVAAQRAGNVLNIDPRLAGIGGLLIGAVHTSGPKAGQYKASGSVVNHPHREFIEQVGERLWQKQKPGATSIVTGKDVIPELLLPDNTVLSWKNQGASKVNPAVKGGATPKFTTPVPGKTYQKVEDFLGTNVSTKPNVSTQVQLPPAVKASVLEYGVPETVIDRVLSEFPVGHILDPRYVEKTTQFVDSSTKYWDQLKNLTKVNSKGIPKKVLTPGRVLNSLMAEPSPVMWDILQNLDTDNFDELVKAYKSIGSRFGSMSSQEMFGAQYIEGHHPVQIESVAKASKHLPVSERLKFINKLVVDYTYGGSEPKDMFGLSKPGHVGKMSGLPEGTQPMNAHQSILNEDLIKPGFTGREGDNWAQIDFTKYKDADSLAKAFWQQSGEPQMRIAEIVFDGPAESTIRQNLADEYGIRERSLYAPTGDKKRGENLKKLLPSSSVLKIIQKAYGSNGP